MKITLLILNIIIGYFCLSANASDVQNVVDRDVESMISSLTIEQKVGQLFMVGGDWADASAVDQIKEFYCGNIYLGKNDAAKLMPRQVAELSNRLQALAQKYNKSIPCFVATDQEGGYVDRLKTGFIVYPSQAKMAESASMKEIAEAAAFTAQQLHGVGIHIDFAPVVDVSTNRESHVARYRRCYSSTPSVVCACSQAAIEGLRSEGIIACVKHFPNDGDLIADPHDSLPINGRSKKDLLATSLAPYKELIRNNNIDMIMISHVIVPALGGDNTTPATLSESVINGFLRNEMGYQGIVVSDELNMRALSSQGSISDVAEKAVNAGCDILLFVGYKNDTKAAYDRLVMAYKSGRLPMNRLDQSVRRILALKRTHINFGSPYVDVKNINRYVNTQPQRILSETLRSR